MSNIIPGDGSSIIYLIAMWVTVLIYVLYILLIKRKQPDYEGKDGMDEVWL